MKKVVSLIAVLALIVCVFCASISSIAAVGSSKWGDVNEDGSLDMKDVLTLRKALAGMTTLTNENAGDVTLDGETDMKDVLYLRKYLAGMEPALENSEESFEESEISQETSDVPGPKQVAYRYGDDGKPYLAFLDGVDDCTLGVWWWHTADGNNTKLRDEYLDFLEKNHTTEIYYYCMYDMNKSSGRRETHEFVQAALSHGIAVSAIYDDFEICNGWSGHKWIVDAFKAYMEQYPEDHMNRIHFDIEPHQLYEDQDIRHLKASDLQNYVDNFICHVHELQDIGVHVEADLNCTWNEYGGETVTCGDTTGIYNIIAEKVDSMCLMAYRDTAEDILAIGDVAFDAAMKNGTRIVYAIETGHYSFNKDYEEFAQETAEYMYTEFEKVFDTLRDNHPEGGYGLAVHQHRTWKEMKAEPTPIVLE